MPIIASCATGPWWCSRPAEERRPTNVTASRIQNVVRSSSDTHQQRDTVPNVATCASARSTKSRRALPRGGRGRPAMAGKRRHATKGHFMTLPCDLKIRAHFCAQDAGEGVNEIGPSYRSRCSCTSRRGLSGLSRPSRRSDAPRLGCLPIRNGSRE